VYRGLTSLSGSEETVRSELVTYSTDQCTSLQTAAGNLLQTVDAMGNAVSSFGSDVTGFCDKMQEVGPINLFFATRCTIISGMGKATNFEFCTHIHRIDRNKSPLKISGKVAVGVLRDSRKLSGHPYPYFTYTGRIARLCLR